MKAFKLISNGVSRGSSKLISLDVILRFLDLLDLWSLLSFVSSCPLFKKQYLEGILSCGNEDSRVD